MTQEELELVISAETHPDDEIANKAMKELRLKYDITYGWCEDCDGLVVKQKDCCMYKVH